ncbi:hypothetical protein ACT80S_08765 [Ramlibacter sp. MAHUQ-53]|uniref:hypothetical protein n=1 Tax=unclassified Ramlibacter TaxID=2617605 RepID=UPI00363F57E6
MTPRRPPPAAARAASARSLADEAAATGSGMLEGTREFAAQALERAAHAVRDLREGVAGTAHAAQRRVGLYADATSRYVAEQPLKSALLAAALGALLMAALLATRRGGSRY